jgi:hypothetical protein
MYLPIFSAYPLALVLRPDLAVDVETCMAPKENLLQQGEDLIGEDLIKV